MLHGILRPKIQVTTENPAYEINSVKHKLVKRGLFGPFVFSQRENWHSFMFFIFTAFFSLIPLLPFYASFLKIFICPALNIPGLIYYESTKAIQMKGKKLSYRLHKTPPIQLITFTR